MSRGNDVLTGQATFQQVGLLFLHVMGRAMRKGHMDPPLCGSPFPAFCGLIVAICCPFWFSFGRWGAQGYVFWLLFGCRAAEKAADAVLCCLLMFLRLLYYLLFSVLVPFRAPGSACADFLGSPLGSGWPQKSGRCRLVLFATFCCSQIYCFCVVLAACCHHVVHFWFPSLSLLSSLSSVSSLSPCSHLSAPPLDSPPLVTLLSARPFSHLLCYSLL